MADGWQFAIDTGRMVRKIEHIAQGYGRVGETVSREFAEDAAGQARNLVHVISGFTKGTIHTVQVNQHAWSVVAEGPGALAEEYGTRYRPPHPFLAPAVQMVEPAAASRFKQMQLDLFAEAGGIA